MPVTGKEARKQARAKMADLKRLSDELTAILHELPIPTPEEFEVMRRGEKPWTEEAHIAAVIRNADFYVDEARKIINDNAGRNMRWLKTAWKGGGVLTPSLERSLRYLVQGRSGQQIPPSNAEAYHYYDLSSRGRAVLVMFLDVLINFCQQLLRCLATGEWEKETGDQ